MKNPLQGRFSLFFPIFLLFLLVVIPLRPAFAAVIYGVTNADNLITFDSAAPNVITSTTAMTGLGTDDVVAIDFRPATGQLYGLGSDLIGTGRLLTIDITTGAVTQVGATFPMINDFFGFDFDPVIDQVRVVINSTQANFRLNPDTGAIVTDTNLSETSVIGIAYTNNFPGSTTSALFGVNTSSDFLVTIPAPNSGVVSNVGAGLTVDFSTPTGLDIDQSGTAFAALNVLGVEGLYTIDLTTGVATFVNTIDAGAPIVLGISAGLPGTLQFSAPTYTVNEDGVLATITVTRVGGSVGIVTVDFATTTGGSATPGVDYTDTIATLNWANGDTAPKTVDIPILDDTTAESNETVNLALTNPTGGAILGTPNTAVLTIVDNENADLSITKTPSTATAQCTQTVTYTITVTNNGPASADNVLVADPVNLDFTFGTLASSQGACDPVARTCALGTIPAGGTATVTLTAAPNTEGTIGNLASVTSTTPDSNSINNTATATVVVAGGICGSLSGSGGCSLTHSSSSTSSATMMALLFLSSMGIWMARRKRV